ncbi:hypothetical protein [Hydrogenophaga sp. OTU3427]|uniref:hypothetical protein n=1 Tax=Hydrogenophaga sp. OTU3427 TaxID=3043856 RepID=UPI00313CA480
MDVAGIARVGAYVPAQRLQAERAAAAAQSRADRLALESDQARSEAEGLLQRADRLSEASAQARGQADSARRAGRDTPATSQAVGQALQDELPTALRASAPPLARDAGLGPQTPAPGNLTERIASLNLYASVAGAGTTMASPPLDAVA